MSDHMITLLGEDECRALITRDSAFTAVEQVFAAMARGDARNFPVIREALGHADALYGFKSGFDQAGLSLGLKSGGYWPGNAARGLTNHQSVVCLFDPDTGRLSALVSGNYLTAIRTAAASAVSIAHLARKNAKVLGILGAGHQAPFQLRAACEQRRFDRVVAWNRSPEKLAALRDAAAEMGLPFQAVTRQDLAAQADVIITIVSAHTPLLEKDWIRPGTHIACMGTDTSGKQEVAADLVAASAVFTDEVAQSTTIGEAQHAIARGLMTADDITPLGAVINGTHPGRESDDQITLFDGTGVGLQDLAAASAAVARANQAGKARQIAL